MGILPVVETQLGRQARTTRGAMGTCGHKPRRGEDGLPAIQGGRAPRPYGTVTVTFMFCMVKPLNMVARATSAASRP